MDKLKNKGGKPKKKGIDNEIIYDVERMCKKIDEYINKCLKEKKVPILKECCLLNKWNYDYLMQMKRKHETLDQQCRCLLDWKEVKLERFIISGEKNVTGAIFSLKQLGWKEHHEEEKTAPIINIMFPERTDDD